VLFRKLAAPKPAVNRSVARSNMRDGVTRRNTEMKPTPRHAKVVSAPLATAPLPA
jgi:hypothetical protein